jgi:hypothetical protein
LDGSANDWTMFAYNANYKKFPLCADPVWRSEDDEHNCGHTLGLHFYSKTGDL